MWFNSLWELLISNVIFNKTKIIPNGNKHSPKAIASISVAIALGKKTATSPAVPVGNLTCNS